MNRFTRSLVWVQAVLSLLVIVRLLNGLDPWGVIVMYWGVNALKNIVEGWKEDEDLYDL